MKLQMIDTNADRDFRNANIITDLGDDFELIDYPAFSYIHATNSAEKPLTADRGGRHLGEAVPGVAVVFPTRTHGLQHKHFGICFDDDGHPLAYGKGVSLTAHKQVKAWLVGADLGDTIIINARRYTIHETPNQNIEFVAAD